MKLITEYLAQAVHFEQLADGEPDSRLKEQLLRQAGAYRELAFKRAAQLGRPPPASSK
jgi:hypothetical protein